MYKVLAIVEGAHGERAVPGEGTMRMRATFARLVVAGTLTAAIVLTPSMALAATGTGYEFGQHVENCAQTMGFSGIHNPGMHQGFAGWDPAHTC